MVLSPVGKVFHTLSALFSLKINTLLKHIWKHLTENRISCFPIERWGGYQVKQTLRLCQHGQVSLFLFSPSSELGSRAFCALLHLQGRNRLSLCTLSQLEQLLDTDSSTSLAPKTCDRKAPKDYSSSQRSELVLFKG